MTTISDSEDINPSSNSSNKTYKTSDGPYPAFPRLPGPPTIQNSALTEIALDLMNTSKRSMYRETLTHHSNIELSYGLLPESTSSIANLLSNQRGLFPPELFRTKGSGQRKGKPQNQPQILQLEDDDGPKPKLPADDEEGEEEGEEQEEDPLLELEPDESESDNDYTTNYYDDEPPDDYDDDNEDAI